MPSAKTLLFLNVLMRQSSSELDVSLIRVGVKCKPSVPEVWFGGLIRSETGADVCQVSACFARLFDGEGSRLPQRFLYRGRVSRGQCPYPGVSVEIWELIANYLGESYFGFSSLFASREQLGLWTLQTCGTSGWG